ncbi:hypothetical protein DFJ74DRAFT_769627 [Hyaloraphidium curvatum]|nr:hypothetical protein DFJ74DRAFT_769627 [Hyaloraphidium curvatum]
MFHDFSRNDEHMAARCPSLDSEPCLGLLEGAYYLLRDVGPRHRRRRRRARLHLPGPRWRRSALPHRRRLPRPPQRLLLRAARPRPRRGDHGWRRRRMHRSRGAHLRRMRGEAHPCAGPLARAPPAVLWGSGAEQRPAQGAARRRGESVPYFDGRRARGREVEEVDRQRVDRWPSSGAGAGNHVRGLDRDAALALAGPLSGAAFS